MARNTRKPHTTMRGKVIDMELLQKKNELTPAVGNSRVNARGDELGAGGKIVRKREDIIKDYYQSNPNAVKSETAAQPIVKTEPVEEKTKTTAKPRTAKKAIEPTKEELAELEEFDEGWEEDEDGNFVKKGDK
jgi:hypothetical protein